MIACLFKYELRSIVYYLEVRKYYFYINVLVIFDVVLEYLNLVKNLVLQNTKTNSLKERRREW